MSTITDAALRQILRAAVEKSGTQRRFATEHGVCQQYVSEILRGTRPPSPRVLAALGLVRVTGYAPASEAL